jgi:hypothetical protein
MSFLKHLLIINFILFFLFLSLYKVFKVFNPLRFGEVDVEKDDDSSIVFQVYGTKLA